MKRRQNFSPLSSYLDSSSSPQDQNDDTTTTVVDDDLDVNLLQSENSVLRETIRKLEEENQFLKTQRNNANANRLVLESFEGERGFFFDEIEKHKNNGKQAMNNVTSTTTTTAEDFAASNSLTLTGEALNAANNNLQDDELWCDNVLEDGTCPIEPAIGFGEALRDRAYWLVGLLIMQSLSGFILASNQNLLANHPVIVYYLTMMVGAGGNAGNQASVRGKTTLYC